jgi:hypothetical protein
MQFVKTLLLETSTQSLDEVVVMAGDKRASSPLSKSRIAGYIRKSLQIF